MSDEAFEQFERETAGVTSPQDDPPPGEVLPPGSAGPGTEDTNASVLSSFITEELVGAIFALPGNLAARKTGDDWWRIEPEEQEILGKSGTPAVRYLVDKYLGGVEGPLAVAGAGLGVVYGPRIIRLSLEAKRAKQQKTPPAQPSPQKPPNSPEASESFSASAAAENPRNSSDWQGTPGDV